MGESSSGFEALCHEKQVAVNDGRLVASVGSALATSAAEGREEDGTRARIIFIFQLFALSGTRVSLSLSLEEVSVEVGGVSVFVSVSTLTQR